MPSSIHRADSIHTAQLASWVSPANSRVTIGLLGQMTRRSTPSVPVGIYASTSTWAAVDLVPTPKAVEGSCPVLVRLRNEAPQPAPDHTHERPRRGSCALPAGHIGPRRRKFSRSAGDGPTRPSARACRCPSNSRSASRSSATFSDRSASGLRICCSVHWLESSPRWPRLTRPGGTLA